MTAELAVPVRAICRALPEAAERLSHGALRGRAGLDRRPAGP